MKRTIVTMLLTILASSGLFAQLTLQGEFRPRFEYRRGYRNILAENQDGAFLVSQRSRLNLYYTLPKISFGFSIQDVRIWGDEGLYSSAGVVGDNASLDLNEGWINVKLYNYGSLKIGRQFWNYEDERILSARAWNQGQVKYDGVLLRHEAPKWQFDLGLSWNNSLENIYGNDYPTDRMRTMNYIYVRKPVSSWATLSAITYLSGFTKTDTTPDINLLATCSGYANFRKDYLKVVLSGSYQGGRSRSGLETNAYMFSARGDYTVGKATFGAGIDYLSGNNAAKKDISYQEKEHSFDILYGVRHRYYGHLDLFSSLQKATSSGGLVDPFVKISYKFIPKATLNADLHYFSLQNNVPDKGYDGTGEPYLKKGLGPELDLNISWDILEILNLQAGYSFMIPSGSMVMLQGIEEGQQKNPQWVWAMLTAKPVFFKSPDK